MKPTTNHKHSPQTKCKHGFTNKYPWQVPASSRCICDLEVGFKWALAIFILVIGGVIILIKYG